MTIKDIAKITNVSEVTHLADRLVAKLQADTTRLQAKKERPSHAQG
jgi:hypothetical protein